MRGDLPYAAGRVSGAAGASALAAPQLLVGVRRSLGFSLDELAGRLGILPMLAAAFEQGRLESLPPWPQTADIVQRWIGLAGIDPAPALSEFRNAMASARPSQTDRAIADGLVALAARSRGVGRGVGEAVDPAPMREAARIARDDTEARIAAVARVLGRQAQPAPSAQAAPMTPSQTAHEPPFDGSSTSSSRVAHWRDRWRRGWPKAGSGADAMPTAESARGGGRPWRRAAGAALLLFMLGGAAFNTSVRAAAVSALPEPAGRAVRSFSDFLAEYFAPVREGHRWIDVADPRSRRGDKLRVHTRLD